jgi:hypothetical protein
MDTSGLFTCSRISSVALDERALRCVLLALALGACASAPSNPVAPPFEDRRQWAPGEQPTCDA